MAETTLSIWLAPILSLLGVVLGFIATAIFNHYTYINQIKLLEKETKERFQEIEKQQEIEQKYKLLDKSLSRKQDEINSESTAFKTYTQLRLEFVRLSAIVRETLKQFDEYSVLPSIETNISSLLSDPSNLQSNILTDVLDVQIYLELYNRKCSAKESKKDSLEKLLHRLHDGNTDCFDAGNNSLIKLQSLKQEYAERILAFQKDGTIIM